MRGIQQAIDHWNERLGTALTVIPSLPTFTKRLGRCKFAVAIAEARRLKWRYLTRACWAACHTACCHGISW
jgi:hypothetical protein